MDTFLFYHEVYEAHEEYTGFVHEVIDWDGEGPPTKYGTKPQTHVEVRTSPQPTNGYMAMDSMDNENDEQCCIVEPMWWAASSGA